MYAWPAVANVNTSLCSLSVVRNFPELFEAMKKLVQVHDIYKLLLDELNLIMCVSFLHYRIQLKEREKEIVDLEARLEKVSGYNSETKN